jgi:hypothetical protein
MTSPEDAETQPGAAPPAPPAPAGEGLLPGQSQEDTDAAWGDHPGRDDDRLYRDRPPHWDDF